MCSSDLPMLLTGRHKSGFEEQQKPTHRNADGGKQNVKGDIGSKLKPSQYNGIKRVHGSTHSAGVSGLAGIAQVLNPNNL